MMTMARWALKPLLQGVRLHSSRATSFVGPQQQLGMYRSHYGKLLNVESSNGKSNGEVDKSEPNGTLPVPRKST